MTGKKSPQIDLFNASGLVAPVIDPNSIYALLHDIGPLLISDEDFSSMYHASTGRPSIPPSLLAQVLLLQEHENLSDREAADRVRFDLRWKYALHLSLHDRGFAHANLCHFRARLMVHGLERLSFDRLNELAVRLGILDPSKPRAIDSSHIFGAAAVQDTYTLLRSALRKLLETLIERDREAAQVLIGALELSEYQVKDKPSIDWDDADARADWLTKIVRDSRQLLKEIDGTRLVDTGVRAAAALLTDILNQDISEGDDGEAGIKQGVAKDRIVSTEDPEMRHGRKSSSQRFDGYKVHVEEDLTTELITNIDVTPGNVHDSEPVKAMLEQSAEKLGAFPSEVLGDSHYGGADLRVELQQHGIEVIAKLPSGALQRDDRFTKADFFIDLEADRVSCPMGQMTDSYYQGRDSKGRPVRTYRFPAEACNACLVKRLCTRSNDGRTVGLHFNEQALLAAREQNEAEDFKTKYRRRALVERKLGELLWRHGLRFGRFKRTKKTRLQALMTAAAVNLKRLGKLLRLAFGSPREAILAVAA